jgi:hypothetical protein
VHHGVDGVVAKHLAEADRVAGVADDELAMKHGLLEPRRQIVENDDFFTRLAELAHDVRADIASASGDENCFTGHGVKWVT